MALKYIKLLDTPSLRKNSNLGIICEKCSLHRGMAIIYYIETKKVIKGVTKEYKAEILEEFAGIDDGFFWTDEHTVSNMITDVNLIKELRALLNKKQFNRCAFGGELHIFIN
jgi:hypothetical protein